jgi:hypothetical protein
MHFAQHREKAYYSCQQGSSSQEALPLGDEAIPGCEKGIAPLCLQAKRRWTSVWTLQQRKQGAK